MAGFLEWSLSITLSLKYLVGLLPSIGQETEMRATAFMSTLQVRRLRYKSREHQSQGHIAHEVNTSRWEIGWAWSQAPRAYALRSGTSRGRLLSVHGPFGSVIIQGRCCGLRGDSLGTRVNEMRGNRVHKTRSLGLELPAL